MLRLNSSSKIQNINNLKNVSHLIITECENIKDLTNLRSLKHLEMQNRKKTIDLGNLRQLETLFIPRSNIEGIHLLINLKELSVDKSCNKKMMRMIKKLKEINLEVEIKFL
jgi:hypothetical protein